MLAQARCALPRLSAASSLLRGSARRGIFCSQASRCEDKNVPSGLGETAKFMLQEMRGATHKQRVEQLAMARTMNADVMSEYDKTVVIGQILTVLKHNFSFDSLDALEKNAPALFAARDNCRDGLRSYIEAGLERIAALETSRRPVVRVMQLYAMLEMPSKAATALLLPMCGELAEGLARLPADAVLVRQCIRFLVSMTYSGTKDSDSEALAPLVEAAIKKIGEGLDQLPLPTPREIDIESKFATSIVAFAVRDPPGLENLARYLERCVDKDSFTSIIQVARFTHCLSTMRIPAGPLFLKLGRFYHSRRCHWQLRTGVLEYVMFNWAFLAQGMQPPLRSAQELCRLLEDTVRNEKALPKRCLVELVQLLPHLPAQVSGLREILDNELVRKYHEARKLGKILLMAQNELRVNQVTEWGFVCAAGLVHDSSSPSFKPWPEHVKVNMIRQGDYHRLSAQPVALMLLSKKHILSEPPGALSGLLERQRRLLTQNGWAVTMVLLTDVLARKKSGDDISDWCLGLMLDAGAAALDKIRAREVRKASKNGEEDEEDAGEEEMVSDGTHGSAQ
eukprot:scpid69676/ scgid13667/ 